MASLHETNVSGIPLIVYIGPLIRIPAEAIKNKT